MAQAPVPDVTALLASWADGDRGALNQLIPLVYDELHRLAHRALRREGANATIVTTVLVHEAYLRLVDQSRARLESRAHFLNVSAQMMRRVLVDAARRRGTSKRNSGVRPVALEEAPEPGIAPDESLLELDQALTRLEAFDPALSRIVDLRYFGGLTLEETADIVGVSVTSAWRDWNTARAWLHDQMATRR